MYNLVIFRPTDLKPLGITTEPNLTQALNHARDISNVYLSVAVFTDRTLTAVYESGHITMTELTS